jgi:hypothetical protein
VRIVAGSTALVALSASLLSGVDPWTCLGRGALGYVAGHVAAGVWCALFPPESVEDLDEPDSAPDGAVAESGNGAAKRAA